MKKLITGVLCAAIIAGAIRGFAARPLPVVNHNGEACYEYLVRKGETIFSITRQFGIDKELFLKYNPEVAADGLKADKPVYFPTDAVSDKKIVPMTVEQITTEGSTHLVQKGETLYGISKRYNTTVDKLVELNPTADKGIKHGQVLILPISENVAPSTPSPTPTTSYPNVSEQDEANSEVSSAYSEDVATDDTFANSDEEAEVREYSIALMLPLMLNAPEDDKKAAKTGANYTAFLKGVLLAADKLGRYGDKVTIYAFDTEGSDERVRTLLADERVRGCDVVVSPDAASQISMLSANKDTEYDVFNIFNIKDASHLNNSRIIQGNIDHISMYDKAIDALMQRFAGYTPVILMAEGGRNEKQEFVNAVKERYSSTPGMPQVQEITFSGNLKDSDLATLSADTEKYVFIPVSGALAEFNRVQAALCKLKESAADSRNVKVFGYPDWIAFRLDRLEKLHSLEATIYSRFYDNPNDVDAKTFARQFQQNFGTEVRDMVPKQELLGYDTGCYLIEALRRGEGDITSSPLRYTGLQSSFDFTPATDEQGMINKALYIISYNTDGSVEHEVL